MEKYGEIPKRFTKKWWEYFWDYYKIHTIAIVVAIIAIVSTIVQCTNQLDYDLSVATVAIKVLPQDKELELCERLAGIVDDIDGKDGTNVYLTQIPLGIDSNEIEYESTLAQRFFIELGFGEAYIYLFSKEYADSYLNRDDCEDSFMPVTDWGIDGIDMSDKDKFMLYMGEPYAMSMESSSLLESIGIDTADCYMMIRYPRHNEENDDMALKRFDNSIKAAKEIIAK